MVKWKPGQTGYVDRGQKAEFIAMTESGHYVVQTFLETEYPDYGDRTSLEMIEDAIMVVPHFFKKPPLQRLHDEVKKLSDEVADRRSELNEARSAMLALERDSEKRREALEARAKQYEVLDRVFDILDEKATHVVVDRSDGPEVLTVEEAVGGPERGYRTDRRLVTLYGKTNGDLQWKLNRYHDGSGSDEPFWFFFSYEDAKAKAVDLVDFKFQEYTEGIINSYRVKKYLESAKKIDHPVPEAVTKKLRQEEISALQKSSENAAKQADEARKALREFQRKV